MPDERAEWLQFAKLRALRYLAERDLDGALASMGSDLNKRDDLRPHPSVMFLGMSHVMRSDVEGLRAWIEGFN